MSDTAVTAFLDRERTLDLLPKLDELERVTGAAAGSIVKRILAGDFHAADCPSVVRLALIGAGTTPMEAAALAAEYVTARPLTEQHAIASTIVLATWAGVRPVVTEGPPPIYDESNSALVETDKGLELVEAVS